MADQHGRDDRGVDLAGGRSAHDDLPAIERADAEDVASDRDFPAALETRLDRRDLPLDAEHADDRLRLRRSGEDDEKSDNENVRNEG